VLFVSLTPVAAAQRGRGEAPQQSARQIAPVDLTGYWVSVVTEDWRFRMVTPAKGDHPSVPLNRQGAMVADAWDPAKDEGAGEQCRAYGAAGVMRLPGRLHITWSDDNTLKIETEAGTQTRSFRFLGPQALVLAAAGAPVPAVAAQSATPSWQGVSVAQWELAGGRRGDGKHGNLKGVTTRMRPGYLQKNGVPYSGNAVLTEYFSRTVEPNGDSWLILTSIVEDPQYLNGPFLRSTHYKKLPDNKSVWEPEACSAR
jgi:hypothetical protein